MSGARPASAGRRRRPRTKTLDVRRTHAGRDSQARALPLAGEPRRPRPSPSFEALGSRASRRNMRAGRFNLCCHFIAQSARFFF